MIPLKFLIPFVLASLAGHALVLTLTTGFGWQNGPHQEPEKVITVELQNPQEQTARRPAASRPVMTVRDPEMIGLSREDSVALRDARSPYDGYLVLIRQKIERRWIYPPQDLAERREGDTLVRFSIEANGALSDCRVVGPSGSLSLDTGTLAVIRAAAPYSPIPADFRLARLHITATFSYRLQD